MTIFLILLGWVVCGVGAAGLWVADFGDNREQIGTGLFIGILGGPIALVPWFFLSGFAQNGWRLWRKP